MFNLIHHWVRLLAVAGTAAATFQCLLIVGTGVTDEVGDWLVTIALYLLFLALAGMVAGILGEERSRVVRDFKAFRQKTPDPRA